MEEVNLDNMEGENWSVKDTQSIKINMLQDI